MAITVTGARAKGFQLLAKDTGALIEDFKEDVLDVTNEYDDFIDALILALDSDKCVGLTRGGSSFTSENELRQIDFDGSRIRFVGDSVKDTATPQIETTLLEFSEENLRRIIPSSDVVEVDGKMILRERLRIEETDYMKSLSWVRERSDGSFIIITLYNPMNQSAVSVTGVDMSEGELPVTFMGFNNDFQDMAYAPYEIVVFNRPEPDDI